MPHSPTCTLPDILRDGSDADLRTLLYSLFSVSRILEGIREALGARLGITGVQFHLLMALVDLRDTGPVGIQTLSGHLRVAPPHVTVEVAKLVKRGLLEKRRDPDDGRAVSIRLTAKAEREIAAVLPLVRSINDRMFSGLDRPAFDAVREAMLLIGRNGEDVVAGLRERLPATG